MDVSQKQYYYYMPDSAITSLADDFTADDGKWKDGNLAAAAMSLDAGKGYWAPTVGSNIFTNGDLEDTIGWSATNCTHTAVLANRPGSSGTHCADLAKTGGTTQFISTSSGASDFDVNLWHRFGGWGDPNTIVSGTGLAPNVRQPVAGVIIQWPATLPVSWTEFVATRRPTETQITFRLDTKNSGANGTSGRYDDWYAKPITLASQFRLKRLTNVASVQAKLYRTAFTQQGVVLFQNLNNWVMAYLQGDATGATISAKLMKCIGGTITDDLVVGTITESAGALLELDKSGTTFTVKYGGSTVNSAVISDSLTLSRAGLFTSYEGNEFDDFAAAA